MSEEEQPSIIERLKEVEGKPPIRDRLNQLEKHVTELQTLWEGTRDLHSDRLIQLEKEVGVQAPLMSQVVLGSDL